MISAMTTLVIDTLPQAMQPAQATQSAQAVQPESNGTMPATTPATVSEMSSLKHGPEIKAEVLSSVVEVEEEHDEDEEEDEEELSSAERYREVATQTRPVGAYREIATQTSSAGAARENATPTPSSGRNGALAEAASPSRPPQNYDDKLVVLHELQVHTKSVPTEPEPAPASISAHASVPAPLAEMPLARPPLAPRAETDTVLEVKTQKPHRWGGMYDRNRAANPGAIIDRR